MTTERDDHALYVIHMRDPLIVAQVHTFEPEDEATAMAVQAKYNIGASTQLPLEYIVLGAIYVAPNELTADAIAGIMRRMADWYRSYCDWEDSQH